MRTVIIILSIIIASQVFAQKKKLIETSEEVEMLASQDFNNAMLKPDGTLYIFGVENKIEGIYAFKVTLGERGKVVSVFVEGNEGGDIRSQNLVKDAVKDFKFSFKLPKGKHFSMHHKFEF